VKLETEKKEKRINGVNVAALHETIRAVRQEPSLGISRFRATNRWMGQALNQTTVGKFYTAGQEHSHERDFVLENDEAAVLLGKDAAANPVEYILHALAGCVTTTTVYYAAANGISIQELETTLEGDLDTRGFLGISKEVATGYQNIRVRMKVKSDATPEKMEALKKFYENSPVFGTLTRGVAVNVDVETQTNSV
jgi:uncharacterized OsmC-like protein